jgi:uncharacterized protein (DUF302 family)
METPPMIRNYRRLVATATLALAFTLPAAVSADGHMLSKRSNHSVAETLDRLTAAVEKKGFKVFARVNHAAGAASVGKSMPATELLIFGNPKVGTALMSSRRSVGLDLPIRVLAWDDGDGKVWIGYTPPATLASRHGITNRGPVIAKMTAALAGLTDAAAR